jgi:hypothetical protein
VITINGKDLTLNMIEHEILRKQFDEPRIHFALVCGAFSCPPLRAEAYEEEKLDNQLDDQGRIFLAEKSKNSFNTRIREASLSPVFNWFQWDFGRNHEEVLLFVSKFLPEHISKDIENNKRRWKIRYTHYDWSLNEKK